MNIDEYYEEKFYEVEKELCKRINSYFKKLHESFGWDILKSCKNDDNMCFLIEEFLDLDSREKAVLWGNKKEFIRLLDEDYNDALGEYHYDQLYG